MFKKLIGIEPLGLIPLAEEELKDLAEEITLYRDIPENDIEIIQRIGDADGVLVSYTSTLHRNILKACPNIRYIGMACSLYSPESANVDIHYAESQGITVTGIRDYGDEGVVEYVISELVRCLHGFGENKDGSSNRPWDGIPREITGLKAGIIGLGKSGGMIADGLSFFGAEISYFSRHGKPEAEKKGYRYQPLKDLLRENEVIISCLNKNVILLKEEEFEALGNQKILFNTGLSPSWEAKPFEKWINRDNRVFCDTIGALGGPEYLSHPNIYCTKVSSGRTQQAFIRLSKKVLTNVKRFLNTTRS